MLRPERTLHTPVWEAPDYRVSLASLGAIPHSACLGLAVSAHHRFECMTKETSSPLHSSTRAAALDPLIRLARLLGVGRPSSLHYNQRIMFIYLLRARLEITEKPDS